MAFKAGGHGPPRDAPGFHVNEIGAGCLSQRSLFKRRGGDRVGREERRGGGADQDVFGPWSESDRLVPATQHALGSGQTAAGEVFHQAAGKPRTHHPVRPVAVDQETGGVGRPLLPCPGDHPYNLPPGERASVDREPSRLRRHTAADA